MKHSGISLATGMFAIVLLAANLAAFRHLVWPVLDFTSLHLALSLLPMLNVLTILGYRLMGNPAARHPFAVGFLVFGLAAMLAHAACVRLYPEQIKWTYMIPIGPSFQLCQAYRVPYYLGVSPEGYSYFRYYPGLVLINFCMPQFVAASLGGLNWLLVARLVRKRATETRAESSPARREKWSRRWINGD